ncbi:MAG: PorV/PorQ family protein [Flavobacteriales bacterium]|nr:PorV/PorQ family protein [Flavobacteriales bacterium]
MKYIVAAFLVIASMDSIAGNKERIGQAGANELLINPWARSTGFGGANSAFVTGVEAFNLNISGLSSINKTELYFSNVMLFSGSDISVNSLALGQRVGEQGVLGICVNAMSFGNIEVTTTDNPDGGQGTFSPQFLNLSLAYARSFSNSIHGGGAIRIISESINNVGAQGVALDAGIRYVTGDYDRMKFGIALRNVGPKMRYSGDGLSEVVLLQDAEFTLNQRAESFEMPALLNIGASYDFYLLPVILEEGAELEDGVKPSDYRLTLAGTFTSNSFSQDQIRGGVEFGFKQYVAVRAGLVYESNIFSELGPGKRLNANTGPTMGVSLMLPFKGSDESGISVDYAYRFANPLGGTHCFGLRLRI